MTATYVLYADFRNCKEPKPLREKLVDKINSTWLEVDKQRELNSFTPSDRATAKTSELQEPAET